MSCKIGTQCFIDSKGIDLENKTIALILSDETSVMRFNFEDGIYDLVLDHSEEAVDLSRKEILPILLQHNTEMLPLGIHENVRLEDRKLKSIGKFDSEDELAMKVFGKMSRGFMPTISVGITVFEKILVTDKNENGRKLYKATKWEITEASIVTVPANPNAKVGLSNKVAAMPDASVPKLANKTIGADMKFDRDDLDTTEATFKALVANRDTLTSRNNSLELQLQTSQTALATKTEELSAIQAEMTSKVSEAEGKLASFKDDTKARLQEAIASGVDSKVALAMIEAETPEIASELALKAKSNTEALKQGGDSSTTKGAWDDFSIKR
jgi:HK97 family phage prohead protease